MFVTLLGTGTPAPSLERQSSGYLVEVASDQLVLDHGPGTHHRLLECGHAAVDVTHAFFTHLHYDHCMDYDRLVLERWDMGAGRVPEPAVYGPKPIARMAELLFGDNGVYGPDIRARVEHRSSRDVYESSGGTLPRARPAPRVREVAPGDIVEGDGWRVTVGLARHVQPQLDCLAYRIDAAEGSVCYSGDSGLCDELVELAAGCDVLIQMNHHFTGAEPSPAYRAACGNHRDNALLARRAGVKTLVLTHVLREIDEPRIREQILREIRDEYDGHVIWGEDRMRIAVRAARGSGIDDRAASARRTREEGGQGAPGSGSSGT